MSVERPTRALLIISFASIVLFVVRAFSFSSLDYWYLIWNLLLAWIPLGLALLLIRTLKSSRWVSPMGILLSVMYLGFLPNSFYIATDFIHVQYANNQTILMDIVMILLFTIAGMTAGFLSLLLIHKQLLTRIQTHHAHGLIAIIIAACSFAIYLGRFLRWNTWDVITNPGGIIFDVSYRLVGPLDDGQMIGTTILFFVLLTSLYWSIWQIAQPKVLAKPKKHV